MENESKEQKARRVDHRGCLTSVKVMSKTCCVKPLAAPELPGELTKSRDLDCHQRKPDVTVTERERSLRG